MCFSPEASFVAVAVLTFAGIAAVTKTTSKAQIFLAVTPFLFALQQLVEGFIWLHLKNQIGSPSLFIYEKKAYVFFAFLIWPFWNSLSVVFLEKIRWRRILLFTLLFLGTALAFLNLFTGIQQPIDVKVVGHSLQYIGGAPNQKISYLLIVILPFFISSLKNAWTFGVYIGLGFILANIFFFYTFASVWCFIAALGSILIYKIIKDNPA